MSTSCRSYGYDDLGQVTSGKRHFNDASVVPTAQYEYVFDSIGNRTSAKTGGDASGNNLRSWLYTPNTLNQYASRTVPGLLEISGNADAASTVLINGSAALRKGAFFDKELSVDNSGGPQYPAVTIQGVLPNGSSPEILTTSSGRMFVPPASEVFVYDNDGNLTQDGRWSYTWDAENRLKSMTSLPNTPAGSWLNLTFVYDAFGRRIQKTVQKAVQYGTWLPYSEERFVYQGWNLIAVMNPALTVVQKNFVSGLDASRSINGAGGVGGLAIITIANTMQMFPAYDGNGNVAALYNTANSTASVGEYEYGPFGEPWKVSGELARQNPFRYSTKYTDDETDLLYYGYRYYNPSTGKWLSRDPLEETGGENLYGMVGNGVTIRVDVNGLFEIDLGEAIDYTRELARGLLKRAEEEAKSAAGDNPITDPLQDFLLKQADEQTRGASQFCVGSKPAV